MELDQNIYEKICARDEAGLSLLYSNYTNSLNGIAIRVLRNQAFAEDAVQKSFLKIWNSIDQFDPNKSTLFTWMARIVRNTAIDIRRLKSFQLEEKSDSIDVNVHNNTTTSIDTDTIDAVKIIKGLDEKYAFVIEYLYLRGYSQSELSDEFDIPLGTIKTRVRKGLEILRTQLKGEKGLLIGFFLLYFLILLIIK